MKVTATCGRIIKKNNRLVLLQKGHIIQARVTQTWLKLIL